MSGGVFPKKKSWSEQSAPSSPLPLPHLEVDGPQVGRRVEAGRRAGGPPAQLLTQRLVAAEHEHGADVLRVRDRRRDGADAARVARPQDELARQQ